MLICVIIWWPVKLGNNFTRVSVVQILIIIRIWTKRTWNYSLFSSVYYLITWKHLAVRIVERGRKIHKKKNEGSLERERERELSMSRPPPPGSPSPVFPVYNLIRSPLTAALYYLNAWNRLNNIKGDELRSQLWVFDMFILVLSYCDREVHALKSLELHSGMSSAEFSECFDDTC